MGKVKLKIAWDSVSECALCWMNIEFLEFGSILLLQMSWTAKTTPKASKRMGNWRLILRKKGKRKWNKCVWPYHRPSSPARTEKNSSLPIWMWPKSRRSGAMRFGLCALNRLVIVVQFVYIHKVYIYIVCYVLHVEQHCFGALFLHSNGSHCGGGGGSNKCSYAIMLVCCVLCRAEVYTI